MNQILIGQFITKKRKEKNLTQEQLAEKLDVSNKTISKWECGKCMPDYSIIENLCSQLDISISELFDGEENSKNICSVENEQLLKLSKEIQNLKHDKAVPKIYISSIILAILGIALCLISTLFGGSPTLDFLSGFFIGISIFLILMSVFLITFATVTVIKKNKRK